MSFVIPLLLPIGDRLMPTERRPLKRSSTAELKERAEEALRVFGDVLEELVERDRSPGTKLFKELKRRRPRPGHLDPPHVERQYSVYVIELDSAVMEKGSFSRRNRGYAEGQPCVYVGMTFHTPEKRFRQHMSGKGSGRFVCEFGCRLRPDLYEERNPLTRREAKIEERALAMEFREEGYGVWQN